MFARLLAVSSLLWLVGCGPFLTLPGGRLEGDPVAPPDNWVISDDVSTIQLETRPGNPYSVNIWAVGMGSHLYVHAGANRATWVEHLEANSQVRIRLEGRLYELSAVRVEQADEFARFCDAYEAKYDRRPRNENVAEVYLFRLGGR